MQCECAPDGASGLQPSWRPRPRRGVVGRVPDPADVGHVPDMARMNPVPITIRRDATEMRCGCPPDGASGLQTSCRPGPRPGGCGPRPRHGADEPGPDHDPTRRECNANARPMGHRAYSHRGGHVPDVAVVGRVPDPADVGHVPDMARMNPVPIRCVAHDGNAMRMPARWGIGPTNIV